jgi:hypothetical protein
MVRVVVVYGTVYVVVYVYVEDISVRTSVAVKEVNVTVDQEFVGYVRLLDHLS